LYYVETLHTVTTGDATVDADVVGVMAKVPAYVQALRVGDNTPVTRRQLLLELDPRDYALQVAAASTALDVAESKLMEARAQIAAVAADVAQDTADIAAADASSRLATDILNRRQRLTDLTISAETKDTALANAETAAANLTSARLKVAAATTRKTLAEVQAKTAETGVAQARARWTRPS
jgi:membrane fusion protein (multidrug efflux system)